MINNFYDLAKILLGNLPTQFEFLYAICAVVLFIVFMYIIYAFFTGFFRKISRW